MHCWCEIAEWLERLERDLSRILITRVGFGVSKFTHFNLYSLVHINRIEVFIGKLSGGVGQKVVGFVNR